MKGKLLSVIGFTIFIGSFSLNAKTLTASNEPNYPVSKYVPVTALEQPDMAKIHAEDLERDRKGQLYRIGVGQSTNITPSNSGLWTTLPNGDRIWQLKIKSTGAEALSFLFSNFKIYDNASFWVQDSEGKLLHSTLTKNDVQDHFQQHIELCFGDEMTLNLLEPRNNRISEFLLDEVMYDYRSTGNKSIQKINESDGCQVNINCTPEGSNWQEEKRGVARILVVDSGQQGWCTGSLVNNLAMDCKPYFLTAQHCGITATAANFNQWKFYFGYESSTCTNPTSATGITSSVITSCVMKATSNDEGGDAGSDFLLVQLGTVANEAATITKLKTPAFNAYWNGWDANNTPSASGVGIHHPSGDIKKISTYTTNLSSTSWSNVPNTHWRAKWAATTNGHGVTEGGSSGSPLFTYNNGASRIVGTLTGGGSFCTNTSSPDSYGKVSYHWQSNTTTGNIPLKTFLDPANTGIRIINGHGNPCSPLGIKEISADNVLDQVTIYPNPVNDMLTVDLSDISELVSIQIFDLTGKLVKTIENQAGKLVEINLSGTADGMYQVVLKTGKIQAVKRVVKQ